MAPSSTTAGPIWITASRKQSGVRTAAGTPAATTQPGHLRISAVTEHPGHAAHTY